MRYLYCAICRDRVAPDDTHGWVTIERRTTTDRNREDTFVLCEDHRIEITDEWSDPT